MKFSQFEKAGRALVDMVLMRGDDDTAMEFTVKILDKLFHWVVYRPSNYTQVWTDHPAAFAKWSIFHKEERQVVTADGTRWSCIQDHDSCWTDWGCNVVGIDFQTDVTVIGVMAFSADHRDMWTLSGTEARKAACLTLVDDTSFPSVNRTGRKMIILSGQRFEDRDSWIGAVYDMVLSFWDWKGRKIDTLVASFDCFEYKKDRMVRMFRALHYKVADGRPILVGVASDRKGEKIIPRHGCGFVQGDVMRFVVKPMHLADNPGRELSIEVSWSKMEPKPSANWPH